jgi:tRNA(Arg) A34 adenosine deaminase TadA
MHCGDIAYVIDRGKTYVAQHEPSGVAPTCAVAKLIQGVYELDPKNARQILRNRIFTTEPPNELSYGMVKVAAKRADFNVSRSLVAEKVRAGEVIQLDSPEAPSLIELSDRAGRTDSEWMTLARSLASGIPKGDSRYLSDRPVAAILVSSSGEALAAAVNCNARNRTRHAEVNLAQGYFALRGTKLPKGATLFVTLKPCRMCAGMLWHFSEDIFCMRVVFGELDPGPHSLHTVLGAGTPDRRRVARTPGEVTCVIEHLLSNLG